MSSEARTFPTRLVPAVPGVHGSTHELEIGVPWAESVATVLAILFFSGISLTFLGVEKGYRLDATQHDSTVVMVQWLVYLLSLPYLVRHRDTLLKCLKKQKLIWLLVLLAIASASWSQVPLMTAKNGVLLCFSTAWGMYFGTRYSVREQFHLLSWAFGLAIVLSYLAAVLLPDYGIMTWEHVGSWEGIYPHRNTLSRAMVFSVLVLVFRVGTKGGSRFYCWLGIAGAAVLVLLSQSKTGLLILLLFATLAPLTPVLRWSKRRFALFSALLGTLAICALLWLPWLNILALLGRNATLTGRLPLWILVATKALQRPWLGYGYNGFWLGIGGESARIWMAMNWTAPNAHNGFLDLWISLGLAGLVVFLIGFAFVFWKAFKTARSSGDMERLWPLAYLVFLFFYNLDETNLLAHNSLIWALYAGVAASMISRRHEDSGPTAPKAALLEHGGPNG